VSLYDIILTLWRHKLVLVLVTVLGAVGGVALGRLLPPSYTAEGVLLVGPEPLWPSEWAAPPLPAGWLVVTERDVVVSPALVEEAFDRVEVPPALSTPDALGGPLASLAALWPGSEAGPSDPALMRDAVLRRVREGLLVETADGSFALRVAHTSPDPSFSAAFANALMEVYVERKANRAGAAKASLLGALGEREAALEARLSQAMDALSATRAEPNAEARAERLENRIDGLQGLRETMALERERIVTLPGDAGVRVVTSAVVPPYPSATKKVFVLLAALLATGGLAAAAVLTRRRPLPARARMD
jgi:uncharacterized protein involved in exopolysaccharide biosynthesis